MTTCLKHTYEFKGNKKFIKMTVRPRGSSCTVSIRAVHVCSVCGKENRRTPNPNFPMPKI